MRRRWLLLLLLAVTLPPALPILGQVRLESGAALDANLQLGSGGYNSVGRGAVGQRNTARLYRPTYSVSRPHQVRRDYHNTMWADRHYSVARSVGGYGGGYAAPTRTGRFVAPPATLPPAPPAALPPPPDRGDSAEAARLMDQISYGIGFYLGQEIQAGLQRDGVTAKAPDVITGFTEGLRDLEPTVPREQIEAVLAAVHEGLRKEIVAQRLARDPAYRQRHDENLARSRAFHEAFGAEDGVVTMPDGIQYRVLEAGTGASPQPTDVVVLNIRSSLVDGTEIARWEGAEVRIDRMVEAGARVLPTMKVGARWLTAIPPQLAYGAAGDPPAIGPNETILAEVELVEIR
jgi:FKBP-type peptidyl-prolyl cis-trans isomerase FklB